LKLFFGYKLIKTVLKLYKIHMKHTLNIDSDLLDRVVSIMGSKTKTDAITFALKEEESHRLLKI
jgi:hypothetical protein